MVWTDISFTYDLLTKIWFPDYAPYVPNEGPYDKKSPGSGSIKIFPSVNECGGEHIGEYKLEKYNLKVLKDLKKLDTCLDNYEVKVIPV